VPGGDTEVLADAKYDHPQVFERIDTARFGLTGPEDLLQGP
jgi:hypothetical protein